MTREIVLNITISELAFSQNDIDPRSHARSSAYAVQPSEDIEVFFAPKKHKKLKKVLLILSFVLVFSVKQRRSLLIDFSGKAA